MSDIRFGGSFQDVTEVATLCGDGRTFNQWERPVLLPDNCGHFCYGSHGVVHHAVDDCERGVHYRRDNFVQHPICNIPNRVKKVFR